MRFTFNKHHILHAMHVTILSCRGIYYSFASRPSLDLAVQPLGLPLPPELLALTGALQGVLQRIISRRMVEPQRRFFDLHRMYTNRHIARVRFLAGDDY